MAKRKEKEPYIAPAYIFLFWDVWMFPSKIIEIQKIEKKKKEKLETHTQAIFCFATLA